MLPGIGPWRLLYSVKKTVGILITNPRTYPANDSKLVNELKRLHFRKPVVGIETQEGRRPHLFGSVEPPHSSSRVP